MHLTAREFTLVNHYPTSNDLLALTIWYRYGLLGILDAMVLVYLNPQTGHWFYHGGKKIKHLGLLNYLNNMKELIC